MLNLIKRYEMLFYFSLKNETEKKFVKSEKQCIGSTVTLFVL